MIGASDDRRAASRLLVNVAKGEEGQRDVGNGPHTTEFHEIQSHYFIYEKSATSRIERFERLTVVEQSSRLPNRAS